MAAAVRILGLDPGLNHTGWGIIDTTGAKSIWVASGVFDIPKGETAARLAHIAREIEAVIKTHLPTVAACERVFVNVNPQSTLLLGHARGAAICAASLAGLAVEEFTPSEIKQAVTGSGSADKKMIQAMVERLLPIPHHPRTDEADALACALCLASSLKLRALEKSGGTNRTYAALAVTAEGLEAPGQPWLKKRILKNDRTTARQTA